MFGIFEMLQLIPIHLLNRPLVSILTSRLIINGRVFCMLMVSKIVHIVVGNWPVMQIILIMMSTSIYGCALVLVLVGAIGLSLLIVALIMNILILIQSHMML